MEPTAAVIRPYREADLGAVYDVCVRTADAGADARGKYRSDDLMPDLFAGPYVYAAAARAGAGGVHVTVMAANARALGFYRRLGFRPLEAAAPGESAGESAGESTVVYLGRRL
jgi:hypothetical protein